MSNEELVLEIKGGNTALYADLWEQMKGLIYRKITGFCACHSSSVNAAGQTAEDLMQCSFIAVYNAVQTFDISKGYKFSTWLNFHLKNAVNAAIGIRAEKRDSLLYAKSLDEPLDDGEGESSTLGNIVADKSAEFEESLVHSVCIEQLRAELTDIISTMPEPLSEVMRLKLDGLKRPQIAERLNMTVYQVTKADKQALQFMRHPRVSRRLIQYRDELINAYCGTGLTAFRTSQQSSVERVAERREYLLDMISANQMSGSDVPRVV